MNKNIKTGNQIFESIDGYSFHKHQNAPTGDFMVLQTEKWISLDWLKEKIKEHSRRADDIQRDCNMFLMKCDTKFISYDFLLSLLEEKQ